MDKNKVKRPKSFYAEVGLVSDPNKMKRGKRKIKKNKKANNFIDQLEKEASVVPKKKFKFGKAMCEELRYYVDKYGDDYSAMARDRRNVYQDSPGQIRAKIKKNQEIQKRLMEEAAAKRQSES